MSEKKLSWGIDLLPIVKKVMDQDNLFKQFANANVGDNIKLGNCDVKIASKDELKTLSKNEKILIACLPANVNNKPAQDAIKLTCNNCNCDVWITKETNDKKPEHATIVCGNCIIKLTSKLSNS